MANVTLEHICKRFGDKQVVDDVNLEVQDGEFLVLVGPSGCGKSTTLRMIAGLEEISAGRMSIGGRQVNDVHPKDRNIAMVFQSYALYPHMTVRQNMSFGLRMRKMKKAEIDRRVDAAAEILGLEDLLDRQPRALSGGQRQRVAMGRAIVRDPAVFLFDEPLSNLDAKLRVQMRAEIARLHQRLETTIIYVTHDQVEAMTLATRIVVMDVGVVQQVGPPLQLYQRPGNRFVAGFIGSPAMNFIDCSRADQLVTGAGLSWTLADQKLPEQVVIGVRPQDIDIEPGSEGLPIQGMVDVVEPMGAETYIHLRVGTQEQIILARIPPESGAKVGEDITVYVPASKVHTFDGQGNALHHGIQAAA